MTGTYLLGTGGGITVQSDVEEEYAEATLEGGAAAPRTRVRALTRISAVRPRQGSVRLRRRLHAEATP